jgi:hypothetical protein
MTRLRAVEEMRAVEESESPATPQHAQPHRPAQQGKRARGPFDRERCANPESCRALSVH